MECFFQDIFNLIVPKVDNHKVINIKIYKGINCFSLIFLLK